MVGFSVNEKQKKVMITVDEGGKTYVEEVSRKFALQFATKIVDVLTGGDKDKMIKIYEEG